MQIVHLGSTYTPMDPAIDVNTGLQTVASSLNLMPAKMNSLQFAGHLGHNTLSMPVNKTGYKRRPDSRSKAEVGTGNGLLSAAAGAGGGGGTVPAKPTPR